MLETGLQADFIDIDGAESGTSAAPLEFTEHVGSLAQEGCCWCATARSGWGCASACASAARARWSEVLTLAEPGALLAAEAGHAPWPSEVFNRYWPLASAKRFEVNGG